MKNLFLIDGATGTSKSDLINYISNFKTDVSFVHKYTTREKRITEVDFLGKTDLTFISNEEFEVGKFDYRYGYGDVSYGFSKKQIDDAFQNINNVFIIVRNEDLIKKLKNDYNYLNVVSIYLYVDKDRLKDRLQNLGYDSKEIQFRTQRTDIAHRSYLKNPNLYDEILIDSGSRMDFERIIDLLWKKYMSKSIEYDLKLVPINEELKRYFFRHPEKLYDLDPRKFEELVADILKDFGFDVKLTRATRDGGFDIYAYMKNEICSFLTFVECKRWLPSNRVGIEVVQRLQGVQYINKADKSMIVTTSYFTPDAIREHRKIENSMQLVDYNKLTEWLKRYEK